MSKVTESNFHFDHHRCIERNTQQYHFILIISISSFQFRHQQTRSAEEKLLAKTIDWNATIPIRLIASLASRETRSDNFISTSSRDFGFPCLGPAAAAAHWKGHVFSRSGRRAFPRWSRWRQQEGSTVRALAADQSRGDFRSLVEGGVHCVIP